MTEKLLKKLHTAMQNDNEHQCNKLNNYIHTDEYLTAEVVQVVREIVAEETKELRKEKADLIARIKRTRCDGIELLNIERERLTKAKEIIRELISWQILTQYWEAKAKAEAFLNKE